MGIYSGNVEDQLVLPARVSLTEDERRVFEAVGRTVAEPINVRLIIDTCCRNLMSSSQSVERANDDGAQRPRYGDTTVIILGSALAYQWSERRKATRSRS